MPSSKADFTRQLIEPFGSRIDLVDAVAVSGHPAAISAKFPDELLSKVVRVAFPGGPLLKNPRALLNCSTQKENVASPANSASSFSCEARKRSFRTKVSSVESSTICCSDRERPFSVDGNCSRCRVSACFKKGNAKVASSMKPAMSIGFGDRNTAHPLWPISN